MLGIEVLASLKFASTHFYYCYTKLDTTSPNVWQCDMYVPNAQSHHICNKHFHFDLDGYFCYDIHAFSPLKIIVVAAILIICGKWSLPHP